MTERIKIQFEDVRVSFPKADGTEIIALDNISGKVYENEFLCIMGPSGCGKTTLLNCIAGLLKPTSGSLKIDDRQIVAPGADRVVVFQNDAVFPWMTVEQNIAYSTKYKIADKEAARQRVEYFIKLVGLNDFRKAWPKQLSGGMRKRVDLARAYVADPEVMLLDEPFGPLDVLTKERLQEELLSLWHKVPRTVVFITHDIEEALFLGQRVIVMTPRPGKIHTILEPGLPEDRTIAIKSSPQFVELRRRIRQILEDANALEG